MKQNKRKNRPNKKEVPQNQWDDTFDNLKKELENGGKKGQPKEEE
jgi:hypothetical protein